MTKCSKTVGVSIAIVICLLFSFASSAQKNHKSSYRLSQVIYDITDPDLRLELMNSIKNTKLKKGNQLDDKLFKEECVRISKIIKVYAFPPFAERDIFYRVDTLSGEFYNLIISVKERKGSTPSY